MLKQKDGWAQEFLGKLNEWEINELGKMIKQILLHRRYIS